MDFNIQRFAVDGNSVTSTGDWYKLDGYDSFGYVPAGIEFEASSQDESIQRMDGDSLLYAISGISSATGTSDTVTVIASGEISAITVVDSGTVAALYTINVSGGDKTALTVIVGGTKYSVSADGKLTIALPDFGLMTKSDKLKLDAIDTTTLLTKTEAASTYATKAEMREYIRQVVESDTGFVLINGNDSEVGVIPTMTNRKATPTLSADPASINDRDGWQDNITVTTNSSGAISAKLYLDGEEVTDSEGALEPPNVYNNTIWFLYGADHPAVSDYNYILTISIAETDDYAAATIDVPITVNGDGSEYEDEEE